MNKEFPIIETERLILRKIQNNDIAKLLEYWSDDTVTMYMNINSFKSLEEVMYMVNLLNDLFNEDEAIRFAIHSKELDKIIGTCGFNSGLKQEDFIGEIGYEIGREFWGKGFMKEALRALINYGFQDLSLNRIEAYVMINNEASCGILETLGFKQEGMLREHGNYKGKLWDEYIYSLLKREWRS